MERVCQEVASCMSRAEHLPLVRSNTARGCTAGKGGRLVGNVTRGFIGILVTSMTVLVLRRLQVYAKGFARGPHA